jgi:nucleotide-binding universal stress UspA family protein
MEKKILLAVDDSDQSRRAIQYVGMMSSKIKNLNYVLFNVLPAISQYLLDEARKSLKDRAKLNAIVKKNTDSAQRTLEAYKTEMVRMGISEDSIRTITRIRMKGIAKDILDVSQEKLYDAVVVARRGLSGLQEVFMGSVTNNIIEHSRVIPVWLVDGSVSSSKILLAVDGSESSLRAVDHICFILGNNPDVKITLLHVVTRAKDYIGIDFDESDQDVKKILQEEGRKSIDKFYAQARKRFGDSGLADNQVEIKVLERRSKPGKAIIEASEKEDYGTVVIGRRGIRDSFFMGSVSRYIINKTSNRVLWVVP